jgi:hypothetical protein
MAIQIQFRRDTAANWASANPTLAIGELGLETDTGKQKIGTGTTPWNSLQYSSGTQGPTGPAGSQGIAGSYAAQGIQGTTGIQGALGFQGTTGAGIPGIVVSAGTPPTSQSVLWLDTSVQGVAGIPTSAFQYQGDSVFGIGPAQYATVGLGQNYSVLTADTTKTAGVAWKALPVLHEQQVKTTGSSTWTAPDRVTTAEIIVVGGGGGGGAGGQSIGGSNFAYGGGGGGAIFQSYVSVTPGVTYNISVGAGGAFGQSGGSSSFGSYTAQGGYTGHLTFSRPNGDNSYGAGAPAHTGGGNADSTQNAADNTGGGGGAAGYGGSANGNCQGGSGIVIVRWLI